MGCTSAEPISVSVLGKVQLIKLDLPTVEIPSHLQKKLKSKFVMFDIIGDIPATPNPWKGCWKKWVIRKKEMGISIHNGKLSFSEII